ncbi:MAG: MoaD/ThiS family protein [Verrucomicrobiota bacterium]|nr:MoaD/ThiS family protein [Verrucomicrobiota bacterium]
MTVTIHFWAHLKDITKAESISRNLEVNSSISDLLTLVYEQYPKLTEWDKSILIANGTEYAQRGDLLQDGDIISLMPPVQGG